MCLKLLKLKIWRLEVENYDTELNIVEFEGKFTPVDLPSLEVQCSAKIQ